MADETIRLTPEAVREVLSEMRDGEAITASRDGTLALVVKCSHVEDGACTTCLQRTLTGFLSMAVDMAALRRHAAALAKALNTILDKLESLGSLNLPSVVEAKKVLSEYARASRPESKGESR